MCIVFLYSGYDIEESDYIFILASNRDEFYRRPAKNAAPWVQDGNIIGGQDLETGSDGGTWLGISPLRKKLGLLLNLPGNPKPNAKTRGKVIKDFLSSNETIETNAEYLKKFYGKETNDFMLVTVDFRKPGPVIQTYNNVTNDLDTWLDVILGFSNSLPDTPLKKTEAGKRRMEDICKRLNKTGQKHRLVEELIDLLRWDKRHLPDPEIERRNPSKYEQLSSVFVSIPDAKYGTRTHTLVLVTKTGHADFIEITMQAPISPGQPEWKKSEFQFQIL